MGVYYNTQGEGKSESGTAVEICVARSGVGVVNLGITMEDHSYDETMNSTYSVVTDELTIPKVTADLVKDGIGEAEWTCVGSITRYLLCVMVDNYDLNMKDMKEDKE